MNPNRHTIDNPSGNADTDALRGFPTQADIDALRARNEQRARAAITALGTRYCCHWVHSPKNTQTEQQWPEPPRFLLRVA